MDRQIRKKKILSILFSLCILLVFVSCNSASSNKESLNEKSRVEHIEGVAIDVDSPYELVGFSDYYFICEVISQKDTEYRDPITIETEHGAEEITSPYTNYEIKVIKNIKGDLPIDKNITITKAGGISESGDLILYENYTLLDTGQFYAITATAQPYGSLLVSGPNSSKYLSKQLPVHQSQINIRNIRRYMTMKSIMIEKDINLKIIIKDFKNKKQIDPIILI
ncbi:hypothetical protein [Anaerococcus nagyae]|uniref:Lipoprotein n=2 Tax=Anaerococcus TaxID=165779 RepID=A0A3E2TJR8_9FIRM|nr:hypothetical protein [Anaerococcus nagyae]RGB77232.1 hypothetical protein DXA39_03160 [Anaerococcus nagyae]